MSKPVNPAVIGGFTVGALVLLVLALLLFGAGKQFNASTLSFVVFFDSSLNGLAVGAPVKMQGVQIGSVKEISLLFDQKRNKLFKPVVIEIQRGSLNRSGDSVIESNLSDEQRKANLEKMVEIGFRARLEMQSLLTGLLYVDLDVHPDKPPMFTGLDYKGLLELPGVPTTTDELKNTAEEFAKKLRAMPVDQIVTDFADSLREIKTLLSSEDTKKSQVALVNTLQGLEKSTYTLNKNLEPLLKGTTTTVTNADALVKETQAMIKQIHQELPQLFANSDKTLVTATAALKQAEDSLQRVGDAVGPESELTDTLQAFKETARVVRDLADYLERHPEALLSGKSAPEN
jgi:paraquat-inducible protein B